MNETIVLKIGGSIITDRNSDEPAPLKDEMHRTAEELSTFGGNLVLIHGAGSYGHPKAASSNLHKGINADTDRMDLAVLQRLQNELNVLYCDILQEHSVPAFPLQASACCTMKQGELHTLDTTVLHHLLENDLVPVLYGTPAIDARDDVSILSGDVLAPAISQKLGADNVFHATDVNGVYNAYPPEDDADIIEVIDKPLDVYGDSGKISVTGGMEHKVQHLLEYGQNGRIFSGKEPGNITTALDGAHIGTQIVPQEQLPQHRDTEK